MLASIGIFFQSPYTVTLPNSRNGYFDEDTFSDDELEILTQTLGVPLGIQGFEGDWDAEPNEIVEIAVQLVTPPEVALRLLHEETESRFQPLSEDAFEEQALAAHDVFWEQFAPIASVTPFGDRAASVEVLSEHHSLFNGVFMRAPEQGFNRQYQ